jgi:putative phosphonate transport system ATP-binding protein
MHSAFKLVAKEAFATSLLVIAPFSLVACASDQARKPLGCATASTPCLSGTAVVELDTSRIDDKPRNFSGVMQQRIQVARNLIHGPRLVFMDEPTGGLDVSVQARLLDLLRELVRDLQLSAIIVTHDMGVARLMADRLLVMKNGDVVETGLTDQVLDDAQHPYTQLLVSSVLQL